MSAFYFPEYQEELNAWNDALEEAGKFGAVRVSSNPDDEAGEKIGQVRLLDENSDTEHYEGEGFRLVSPRVWLHDELDAAIDRASDVGETKDEIRKEVLDDMEERVEGALK